MKVLWLLPEWIFPANTGLRIDSYCLIRNLARMVDCNLVGLNLSPTRAEIARLFPAKLLGSFPSSRDLMFRFRQVKHFLRCEPISLARFHCAELKGAVERLCEEHDIVCYDTLNMAPYMYCGRASVLWVRDA